MDPAACTTGTARIAESKRVDPQQAADPELQVHGHRPDNGRDMQVVNFADGQAFQIRSRLGFEGDAGGRINDQRPAAGPGRMPRGHVEV